MINLENYVPFDKARRVFIKVPGWRGGHGLALADKPEMRHALPERKPGKEVETSLGMGTIVRTHHGEGRFYNEGILVDGIFFRPHRPR